jgi:hypothetical protein
MSGKAAVEALVAAVAARDIDAVAAAMKGGKIDVVPLDIKGAAGTKAKEFFGPLFTAFPDLEVTVRKTVIAGEKALVDVVLSGPQKEPYLDVANRGGRSLESRQAWVVEANGSTVASLRVFFCRNELKWSLGANKTYEEAIAGATV